MKSDLRLGNAKNNQITSTNQFGAHLVKEKVLRGITLKITIILWASKYKALHLTST